MTSPTGLGRLLVFVDEPFWRSGGAISTDRAFILFVQALVPSFNRLVLLGRVHPEPASKPYPCAPRADAEFHELPYYGSLYTPLSFLGALWRSLRVAWHAVARSDVLLLGIPHPLALPMWVMGAIRRRPVIFLVRQDLLGRVRLRSSRVRRALAVLFARTLEGLCILLARRTLTFTVGEAMFRRYHSPGAPVHSLLISLIRTDSLLDSVARHLPPPGAERRLLWVGRLDPDKGLEILLECVRILLARHTIPLHLDLVGTGALEEELRRQVRTMGLHERVTLRGYLAFGPQLEALYRNATVFVLPSNESEGFPQVVIESLAVGLPIVSTAVAGIPFLLRDGVHGLLVPPRNPRALAGAVERVLTDPELYLRLSASGLDLARQHTLEAEREKMLARISRHLARSHPRRS